MERKIWRRGTGRTCLILARLTRVWRGVSALHSWFLLLNISPRGWSPSRMIFWFCSPWYDNSTRAAVRLSGRNGVTGLYTRRPSPPGRSQASPLIGRDWLHSPLIGCWQLQWWSCCAWIVDKLICVGNNVINYQLQTNFTELLTLPVRPQDSVQSNVIDDKHSLKLSVNGGDQNVNKMFLFH